MDHNDIPTYITHDDGSTTSSGRSADLIVILFWILIAATFIAIVAA